MMFDIDDTASNTSAPRELSQDVQALISNGLDFLGKARKKLEASKPKFPIVSFWTAVEILLKVPLTHEHWPLVCSPKRLMKKQTYLAGDFQSMAYEETRERLRDVLEEPLDRETDNIFDKVRKHHNRVVHFYRLTFTEAEQCQMLKEQADAWFALNRLLGDERKVIFGIRHNWKLVFGETRLTRGNKSYVEVRFKQVKPRLEQLSEENIQIGNCNECHQHTTVTGTETTGDENRKLRITRCKVCTSAVRQITLVCPDCEIPQLLPGGDSDFKYEHCGYTSDRYKLLDEELLHSVDEQLLSVFPAECTSCMTPESVCEFGNDYLCTQCFTYYTELHVYSCCGHLGDSVPELSHIRRYEFCDGDQRYLDD